MTSRTSSTISDPGASEGFCARKRATGRIVIEIHRSLRPRLDHDTVHADADVILGEDECVRVQGAEQEAQFFGIRAGDHAPSVVRVSLPCS